VFAVTVTVETVEIVETGVEVVNACGSSQPIICVH
jgi:hypothetical protein